MNWTTSIRWFRHLSKEQWPPLVVQPPPPLQIVAPPPIVAHCSHPDVAAASNDGPTVTTAFARSAALVALPATAAILTGNQDGNAAAIAEAAAALTAAAHALALPPESFVYFPFTVGNLN